MILPRSNAAQNMFLSRLVDLDQTGAEESGTGDFRDGGEGSCSLGDSGDGETVAEGGPVEVERSFEGDGVLPVLDVLEVLERNSDWFVLLVDVVESDVGPLADGDVRAGSAERELHVLGFWADVGGLDDEWLEDVDVDDG